MAVVLTRRAPVGNLLLGLAVALLACCGIAAIAPGSAVAKPRLTAKIDSGRPAVLEIGTQAPRGSERVAYIVDGRQLRVDHAPSWRSALRAANASIGRHRLTTRVFYGHGRVRSDSRMVFLDEAANPRTGSRWRLAPSGSQGTNGGAPPADLVANFEDGLNGWNLAGVGDVVPTVATDTAKEGSGSANVTLTGTQERSELILGGGGCRCFDQTQDFFEGDEGWYGFSFLIKQMQYGRPGAHNLIYQFHSDGTGSPPLGLMLWDYEGDDGVSGGRGLWSHGSAMGGGHFLAPLEHHRWYDVAIHYKASRTGNGFYEIYLDGRLLDSRRGVNTIRTDRTYNYMKNGLYRNGTEIPGTSEIRLDNARLGSSMAAVSSG